MADNPAAANFLQENMNLRTEVQRLKRLLADMRSGGASQSNPKLQAEIDELRTERAGLQSKVVFLEKEVARSGEATQLEDMLDRARQERFHFEQKWKQEQQRSNGLRATLADAHAQMTQLETQLRALEQSSFISDLVG